MKTWWTALSSISSKMITCNYFELETKKCPSFEGHTQRKLNHLSIWLFFLQNPFVVDENLMCVDIGGTKIFIYQFLYLLSIC